MNDWNCTMVKPTVCLATIAALLALEVGALDGQWCSSGGQTIKVNGTDIVASNGIIHVIDTVLLPKEKE